MAKSTQETLPVPTHFFQTTLLIGPMQIITASDELFNHVDNDLPMWAGEGDRCETLDILFVNSFKEPPAITLGVIGLDSDHSQNTRFWLEAINIRDAGFTIEFKTWGYTHIARAGVSWQALGEV